MSDAIMTSVTLILIGDFFFTFGISNLLASIKKMQIIVHMVLVNVSIPANAALFYAHFLEIVNFDILPTDGLYEYLFDLKEGDAISVNFEMLGYETIYMIKNLGSVFIFMMYFPIVAILAFIFKRLKNVCAF